MSCRLLSSSAPFQAKGEPSTYACTRRPRSGRRATPPRAVATRPRSGRVRQNAQTSCWPCAEDREEVQRTHRAAASLRFHQQISAGMLWDPGPEVSVPLRLRPAFTALTDLDGHAPDEGAQLLEAPTVMAGLDKMCSTRLRSRRCAGSLPARNWTTKARGPACCAWSVAHPIVVSRRDGSVIAHSA
jgi:hypothetical protein